MSNRIAVMSDGLVQQVGSAREIYEEPTNRFVADFIGETNFIDGKVTESGSYTTLESNGVAFSGHSRSTLGRGTSATVAIRPEKIWLYGKDDANGHGNNRVSLNGRISDVIYIGTDTRYQVKLATGDNIFVRVQNLGQEQDVVFHAGDEVAVQWSADNAQVLTE